MSQNFINNDVWVNLNSNNFVFNKLDFRGRGKKKKSCLGIVLGCLQGRESGGLIHYYFEIEIEKKKTKNKKRYYKNLKEKSDFIGGWGPQHPLT